jgi:hypothetical protein
MWFGINTLTPIEPGIIVVVNKAGHIALAHMFV